MSLLLIISLILFFNVINNQRESIMNHTTKPPHQLTNHPYLFSYRPALLAATIAAIYLACSPTAVLAADMSVHLEPH